ncbi:hypothetical protein [Streptomyces lydicus]|uniref:hypothetical protein n=1 Tax=Streptomyces lydicus TaxID=47763 RepID=UPI0036E6BE3B
MNIRIFTGRGRHRPAEQQHELARLRADYANLCREHGATIAWQLAAIDTITDLTTDNHELKFRLHTAIRWSSDADVVNACLTRTNTEQAAEIARLRGELAAVKAPAARVIPLQKRGVA